MLGLLLSTFSFCRGQFTVNEADDFMCRAEAYATYSQVDSILLYIDDAIGAYEKIGEWESYVEAMIHKGSAFRDKRQLAQAQEVYEKALFTALSRLSSSDPILVNLYGSLGLLALWQTNYPEAINWFSRQIKAAPEKNSQVVAGAEINMGLVYVYLWRFEEARTHCEIGIEILKKLGMASHPFVSNAYLNIGLCYSNEEAYQLALTYFEQALNILLQAKVPNKAAIANVYGNMSNMNDFLERHDLALQYMEKSLKLQKESWGEKHTWVAHCYHNLGRIHLDLGNKKLAINYIQKALKIRQELLPPDHKDIVKSYNFLGTCYKELEQYALAEETIRKGIAVREQAAPHAIELVFARQGLAEVYRLQEKYEAANKELDKAMYGLNPGPGWEKAKNGPRLISYYTAKARNLEKHAASLSENQKAAALLKARDCYRLACDLNNYVQRQRHDESSKNKIASDGQAYGAEGLRLAFSLYEQAPAQDRLEEVFWFMENNKARLLHEAVQKSKAELMAGIPDSLRQLERSLSLDFSFYDQQLQHELSLENEADTVQLKKLKQTTFRIRTQRDSLRHVLEKSYPAFRWLNFESHQLALADVQAQLKSADELMVEFAFVDTALFAIAIRQTEVKAFRIRWNEADNQVLEQFILFLHDPERAQNEGFASTYLKTYESFAWPLYEKLLAPILTAFPTSQRLTIIPDKLLGHIPFEALLTAPLAGGTAHKYAYDDMAFLLRKYSVSYTYSASLPSSDSLHRALPQKLIASFAPRYEGNVMASSREIFHRVASEQQHAFGHLQATEQEVTQIQHIMGGDIRIGDQANKQAFLKEAGNYRLLHLAMHAFTHDSLPLQSGLVFAPGKDRFLYSYEIYNLPLRAELVVLSACHTGFGKYQAGEGIMSLARAFRFAGAPNIVMSLWQADDQSSALLMQYFYQNLQEGMGKDEALRQAKLSFLADGGKPMPYYWAGFVLMGDAAPLELQEGSKALLWGSGVVLLIALGFFWWRKRDRIT